MILNVIPGQTKYWEGVRGPIFNDVGTIFDLITESTAYNIYVIRQTICLFTQYRPKIIQTLGAKSSHK